MAPDEHELERRLALLEYKFDQHNTEADRWKERIVEMEHLIHHGRSLLVAARIMVIGGAFLALAASQGLWAAIVKVFRP